MNHSHRIPVPQIPFEPPVYLCPFNEKRLTLDGRLDKDFWADVPFTDDFKDIEGESRPVPRFRTRAKMAWDQENFYIGAILEGDEIWAHLTEHDSVIFNDNDFEIFIDPDSDTQAYFEYEMNARNTYWDLLLTKAYRGMGLPVNGYEFRRIRTAVHIDGALNQPGADNRSWSMEVVIPFAALAECSATRRPPLPGEYYRVNFSRVQWKVDVVDGAYRKRMTDDGSRPLPEDNWVWAPTGVVNIHYPELWGFVFFMGKDQNPAHEISINEKVFTEENQNPAHKAPGDEKIFAGRNRNLSCKIPEDEACMWELRKLYYAQQAVLDETGSFTDDLDQLRDTLRRISPCLENAQVSPAPFQVSTTPHSFEVSCPSPDGKETFCIFSDGAVKRFPTLPVPSDATP
ncbi:MAG: carbohydrate-binding family 9-like protein [Lachnospiraceae bacterium]|nr:carbohydrate-binding family 9-like protein [Lachnospiraceae bacterium]